ncbi:MAG: hypothetical protein Q7S27_01380 [Nanoarchaeota archaeon]|nr:hypothetical protein [Nanoarchaeota archaeon]
MRLNIVIASLILTLPIFSINLASAGYNSNYYNNPNYPDYYYNNDPSRGYEQFPIRNFYQDYNSRIDNSNFDSTALGYDYRGPLYERTITYTEDFHTKRSDKSLPFYSRSRDSTRYKVSSTLSEKYVGATESLFYNTQNRRQASAVQVENTINEYDGGFTYGKQRLYDPEEYPRDSYTSPYYYRPNYNSEKGYYNWRY